MKDYLSIDPWKIKEEGFHPENNRISESIFSLGNGRMGQRGNFEEDYSGDSLQGSYIAGIYYPDPTKVGWWKNGYPEYFAKVINSVNWIGIKVEIDGINLDLHTAKPQSFDRILHMKKGFLERKFTTRIQNGKTIKVNARRFNFLEKDEVGILSFKIQFPEEGGKLKLTPYLDFNVTNEDANYGQKFWERVKTGSDWNYPVVQAKTKKLDFEVNTSFNYGIYRNGKKLELDGQFFSEKKLAGIILELNCEAGDIIEIQKNVVVLSSLNYDRNEFLPRAKSLHDELNSLTFDELLERQADCWKTIWDHSDIVIKGDPAAQQAIRFNIFQLHQTYSGKDSRLNIGPKGFTGEKYGGSTYWDTEAYCIPFFLSTAEKEVSRNLLLYRYRQLDKAIENAEKLGFTNGAALYPMVTMNGEECHNEWEITFEEIHRNGAIAYAIYDYVRYTGDEDYLKEYGFEVLIAICRFWAQRVNFSQKKQKYVMLGVTGPNEYENNVDNNWYTLYIARWCMQYTRHQLSHLRASDEDAYKAIQTKINLEENELYQWAEISRNLHFPYDEELGLFLQQENFLDKELKTADSLPDDQTPIWQNWSWDRILRSCFIKQADVLQGMYFFADDFDLKTLEKHFDFYEPMTVHESSLSPCVHSILASKLGRREKAYEMYLRTSRLDLDDYNNDTEDGLHITSMAGTWMSVVKGFGGLSIYRDHLALKPILPEKWEILCFHILFRGITLEIEILPNQLILNTKSKSSFILYLDGKPVTVYPGENIIPVSNTRIPIDS